MVNEDSRRKALIRELKRRQSQGDIAELSIGATIRLRPVGRPKWLSSVRAEFRETGIFVDRPNEQAYYFLSQELRPGSGVVRVFGGKSEGPGGTLTCFLSSKDGGDNYFVAAGHVLSNFWAVEDVEAACDCARQDDRPTASIYRYQKGYPATNSTRFLGKLTCLSEQPKSMNRRVVMTQETEKSKRVDKDIGIVKIRGSIYPVQRTTCYGSFGEWPRDEPPEKIPVGMAVMKCGAEETHLTEAVVINSCTPVSIYGPNGLLYELHDQVILGPEREKLLEGTDPPENWSAQRYRDSYIAFAVPGDSGTMVVERESRRPVGMLIAGSVLDGRYVMTPIRSIQNFWKKKELILRRG
jgi:hypothetical protein